MVVDLAAALAGLSWPVSSDAGAKILGTLGWRPLRPGMPAFATGLGITPDVATVAQVDGEITTISVNLIDYIDEEGPAREAFASEAFGAYVVAMKDRFGDSRIPPFPRDHDASYWDMAGGSRVTVLGTDMMATLMVESPALAEAKRAHAARP